ncbi:MAG: hypothetical protein ABIK39_03190 [candidate division WOR-3 bacterium]
MTGIQFNYKDVFRALRMGFSAKKIGMAMVGLLIGLAGYSLLTYIAHIVAGNDWLSIWETYRLLPFPAETLPFPWYSWVIYAIGVIWALCVMLLTGTAIAKVTCEQLKGNEFFEAGEAFRFSLKNAGAVLGSPLLIIAFIALVVIAGLILSAMGSIPKFGPIFVGLMGIIAFLASLFITYLLIVLVFTIFLAPSVVGAMGNDTFDTLFEVFSCVNEQPARLVWYTFVIGFLAKVGSFLLGLGSSLAGRIGSLVLLTFMRDSWKELLNGASFIFKVAIPNWGVFKILHYTLLHEANLYGLPQIYLPEVWENSAIDLNIGAMLLGLCGYAIALMVIAYGCAIWFSGNVLSIAVLIKKKDDKNIFEVPEEESLVAQKKVDSTSTTPQEPTP